MLEKLVQKLSSALYYCTYYLVYKNIFKKFGNKSRLKKPLRLQGIRNIIIGDNVIIEKLGWLAADNRFGKGQGNISIGNGSYIGNFCHIYSTNKIEIGQKVLIADKVYITDNSHSFENVLMPIIDQPVKQLSHVSIGEGSWLGEHVSVIGVKIGKHSIIGANSVVTKNIGDYCIAVGSPARIVKRYDFNLREWRKTNPSGDFL